MRKKTSVRATGLLACLLLSLIVLGGVPALRAQVSTGKPIKLKIKTPKQKHDSFRGDVMNFTNAAITVRDRNNMALLRTFNYTPELARKVENRRLEPGQRVTVRYIRGTNTAVALNGKLRKEKLPYAR